MLKLTMPRYSPRFVMEFAVEAAAVIGFNSVSIDFPVLSFIDPTAAAGNQPSTSQAVPAGDVVVSIGADDSPPGVTSPGIPPVSGFSLGETAGSIDLRLRDAAGAAGALAALCAALEARHGGGGKASGDALTGAPGVMEGGYQPFRTRRGLESLFEREFIVKDRDFDFLPDSVDASIALPADCDDWSLSAACDLAARLGIESLGLDLPVLEGRGRPTGTLIVIEDADRCGLTLAEEAGRRIVRVAGRGEALARMASSACRSFPESGGMATWPELCDDLSRAAAMRSLDGQLAWLDARAGSSEATVWCEPGIESRRKAVEAAFPAARFINRRDLVVLSDMSWDFPWEVDVCREVLQKEVYPRIEAGKPVEIELVVSEGGEVRAELEAEIRREAMARDAAEPRVRVVCAFKQGLSWVRDCVMPELAARGGVASVELLFSAFLPGGRTAWTDEDGATPKISAQRADDPDAWLDPPVRLLQELYPIDDLLAAGLGIARESIVFGLLEGEAGPKYRLVARDQDGAVVHEAEYEASFSERTYLDDFPGIGKVHPGTGRVSVRVGGAAPWTASFPTDMERIWAVYQAEVLPACRRRIEEACGGTPDAALQPYFAQLRLDIDASEPDEALPVRQDRLSSLESLHEDIYFAGLDYFQTLGLKSCGKGIDAPGLILPVIRKRPGPPSMRFRLLGEASTEPALESGGRRFAGPAGAGAIDAWIDRFDFEPAAGTFSPRFAVGPAPDGIGSFVRSYARLLSEGLLAASSAAAGIPSLGYLAGGQAVSATPPGAAVPPPPLDVLAIDLLEDRLIGYEEYLSLVDSFSRVPGLRVRQVAESRQGRAIHSFELLPSLPGYVSRTKLIAGRPVYYVNARHHANEVSGTNAAFMLLRTLLSDPGYAGIADRVNIVVVPFENADGAAIHYELAKDNPEWILHIARYNSLGKEIAHEYWKDSTIHGEAMAFTKVWRDWLPDVVTDNHGVPSHEWCQQFSGYTSPWFKGFWMPRALLYGYFWYVTDGRWAANKVLAEGMQEAVADRIGADPECGPLNAEWKGRFEKYAHAWMPRLFPAEYHKDMIFYWVPFPYKPDYYYAAVRFPWVTAASFVTEVSDETATGNFLRLCARTHELNDLAVIGLLAAADPRIEAGWLASDGGIRLSRNRSRPPAAPRATGNPAAT